MKLWKCEPYMPDNKGLVWAVVMAETRQQAIEKASARLLTVLGQWFPDDDYRRFAQLGSDHLDSTLEEVPEEAAIFMVPSPPSLEDGTQAPQPEAPAGGLKLSQPELRSRSATHETLPPQGQQPGRGR